MKKRILPSLFGVGFLLIALLITGNLLDWWSVSSRGWWTLFLIIPGIAGIVSEGFSLFYSFMTLLGVWLLAKNQGWLDTLPVEILYIVVCVIFGLWLIFNPLLKSKKFGFTGNINSTSNYESNAYAQKAQAVSQEFPNASSVFTGNTVKCTGIVKGGSFNAVFGGIELHLEDATIQDGAEIKAKALFGGIDIYTGGRCRVISRGTSIFGGVDDKTQASRDNNLPVLYVKQTTVFGGIDIK